MTKIVFTGGPSAGKSSFIQSLKLRLLDREDVFFAPEIATMLLGQGFPRFSSPENVIYQQRAIFKTQMEMENLLEKEKRYRLCFFDRGLIDALAYVQKPEEVFASHESLFSRYDHVFHLEVAPIKGYTQTNNKSRTEDHHQAIELENRLKSLWSRHENYNFISSKGTFLEKVEDFLDKYGPTCGVHDFALKETKIDSLDYFAELI
jgi:predicted ATPase